MTDTSLDSEAREKCRETLFAIMVTRGSVDQMLDAIIPIIERDTANETWEAAAKIAESHSDHLGGTYSGKKIAITIRSRIIKGKP